MCIRDSRLGDLLNETWIAKRGISSKITNPSIDELHQRIMSFGARGAKLLGAGNGGFILVYGEKELREKMENSFDQELVMFPLEVDFMGSRIIHGTS